MNSVFVYDRAGKWEKVQPVQGKRASYLCFYPVCPLPYPASLSPPPVHCSVRRFVWLTMPKHFPELIRVEIFLLSITSLPLPLPLCGSSHLISNWKTPKPFTDLFILLISLPTPAVCLALPLSSTLWSLPLALLIVAICAHKFWQQTVAATGCGKKAFAAFDVARNYCMPRQLLCPCS